MAPLRTTLLIQLPGQSERQVRLDRDLYRLGRGTDNEIVIPDEGVSRHHARLERRGEAWEYTDLDSTNGSFVEGQRVRQVILQDGMRLQLGNKAAHAVTLLFQSAAQVAGPARQRSREPAADAGLTIRQHKEPTTGLIPLQSYQPVSGHRVTIGRDPEADIHLSAPAVSRRHAVLRQASGEWQLVDLKSTNGTSVNGQRIRAPYALKPKDLVQIGPFRLVYEGEGRLRVYVASRGLRLDGQRLGWEVGKGARRKRILDNVSLSCSPQEFVGLVGGSGAGKTTLMKALSGLQPMEGRVLVEGEDLYRNFDAYRSQIGYVPQDDILHKELTVQQALWYSAKLRLPPDVGEAEIQQRIDRVLEQVELTGQKNQTIHSLSGGQRKRASIAVELLADPPLFFLDEPTSGLDPGLEKKMMVTLRKLADGGKTILLVTHATANITECDQVAFMSQGRLVYYGPPRQAGEFFQVGGGDFADIYTETGDPDPELAKQKAITWEEKFKHSSFFQKYVAGRLKTLPKAQSGPAAGQLPRMSRARVSSLRQFLLLTRRYFDLILRDRVLLTILLAIMPLLALLVVLIAEPDWLVGDAASAIQQQLQDKLLGGAKSAVYSVVGNGQALLFIMSLASVLLGLFASAYEIVKERNVYGRERMVFLRLLPYLGSKVVLLGGFAALQCLLFLLVVGLKLHFPAKGVFFPALVEIYLTMFLGALAAIMLGLFLSAIAPNSNAVVYLILGILFLQILFAGVLFELPGMASNLSKITLTRWTTEALGVSADLEYLNSLTQTRFQPDPVTEDVSIDVDKPDPDWQPVTIVTEMNQVPGCSQLVAMPVVQENEMVTVQETVTKSVTVTPDALDVETPHTFVLNYERSAAHLLGDWSMLLGLSLLFGAGTIWVMKRKDVV